MTLKEYAEDRIGLHIGITTHEFQTELYLAYPDPTSGDNTDDMVSTALLFVVKTLTEQGFVASSDNKCLLGRTNEAI